MTEKTREVGVDILKAVCILLVVLGHIRLVTSTLPESAHLIRFIWYTIVFVSVPSFILISLYFFSLKISESGD
ncbi:MAG TPA: hypothetical protein ENN23_00020, partial [Deltaproteobacteria bacterium]|nr:hypothetical protein [Deltaproteobacteria bacterium]